jgi:hypothetical protein
VLFGDDVLPLNPVGMGEEAGDRFPWRLALDSLPARAPLPA